MQSHLSTARYQERNRKLCLSQFGFCRARRSSLAELADESPAPDEATATEEEAALVREQLTKLPETYRLPLVLFYRENQSVCVAALNSTANDKSCCRWR
jgi:DNA-directed RNA polymerase specialized sigma24 family protein